MMDDAPSDLDVRVAINDISFVDTPSQRSSLKSGIRIRSEADIPLRSLALGALMSGALAAAASLLWFAILILPIWWLQILLP